MKREKTFRLVLCGLALLVSALPGLARGPEVAPQDDPASPAAVREAMRDYFHSRLRRELGLSEAQVSAIAPTIERLERSKAEARRERAETVRRLRQGIEGGASDAELQRLLARLDGGEWEQRKAQREALDEIDSHLTARQSVQLRFFMPRFRRDMTERIRDLSDRRQERERRMPPRWRDRPGRPR